MLVLWNLEAGMTFLLHNPDHLVKLLMMNKESPQDRHSLKGLRKGQEAGRILRLGPFSARVKANVL